MKALGAAASVITIVELTTKLGSLCLEYSKAIKNSAIEIKQLQEEVASLENVATQVRVLLEKPEGQELVKSTSLTVVLQQSDTKLKEVVSKLQPKPTRKWRPFTRALKWPFQCEEVKGFIRDIHGYNETISHILQVTKRKAILTFSPSQL
ncbi:uncharacterized protein BROUX77_004995 [Berkeleyomyces rouxiae]|uniref:uncharacterized protein n=1 Tax=Berkeleyomyces rouxiae TaxID=2035830 RepID=UPI003B7A83D9